MCFDVKLWKKVPKSFTRVFKKNNVLCHVTLVLKLELLILCYFFYYKLFPLIHHSIKPHTAYTPQENIRFCFYKQLHF